ncbi:MAG: helix-turn-helix domain-containing protein [Pseudomonadota bacterium]
MHNWDIHPHRHHDLHQVVLVTHGGGKVEMDEKLLTLRAPVLISIPPSMVHGFQWEPDSLGLILTVAENFKDDLIRVSGDAAIRVALAEPVVLASHQTRLDCARVVAAFENIAEELIGERIGRTMTISGNLLIIFSEIVRLKQLNLHNLQPANEKGADIYHRFKELIELHFREHWPVASYAAALAVVERSLRRLTMKFANQSPIQIIHRRLLLEAKRNLLYTDMTIAEVGYAIGFEDPSYFTRFFVDHTGQTPLLFRRARAGAAAPPDFTLN